MRPEKTLECQKSDAISKNKYLLTRGDFQKPPFLNIRVYPTFGGGKNGHVGFKSVF